MKSEHAHWWTRAAQTLSRRGLLWLALTAVALSSLASSGAGATAGARLVAAWSAAATGKLKANSPGSPTVVPGDANRMLPTQAHGPDGDAKRLQAGGTAAGLVIRTVSIAVYPVHGEIAAAVATDESAPAHEFQARAPPRIA